MKKLLTFALVLCLALSMFVVASAEGEKTAINVYRCTFNLAQSDEAQVKKVEDAINEYIATSAPVSTPRRPTWPWPTTRSTCCGPLPGKAPSAPTTWFP